MKCPHCGEVLASILCPDCGGENLDGSTYCCRCGKMVRTQTVEADFSERTPCSDGNCTGTINEKGVCNFCGKSYVGQAT